MANRSGLRMWADVLLDGQLDPTLKGWKAEGLTVDQITRELHDRDIEVSRETVRRWVNEVAA